MGAAVGGRQPVRPALLGPSGPVGRADAQRAELIEGEGPLRALGEGVLDAVQLGVDVGVRGVLPGLGALEGDLMPGQQST